MEQSILEKIKPGMTIRVHEKIKDGGKARVSVFEGIVIGRKHHLEAGATFTVRKVSQGVGFEKIFPLYSPNIEKIEFLRSPKVRRAKLYFLRKESEKEIRKKLKREMVAKTGATKEIELSEEKPEEKISENI